MKRALWKLTVCLVLVLVRVGFLADRCAAAVASTGALSGRVRDRRGGTWSLSSDRRRVIRRRHYRHPGRDVGCPCAARARRARAAPARIRADVAPRPWFLNFSLFPLPTASGPELRDSASDRAGPPRDPSPALSWPGPEGPGRSGREGLGGAGGGRDAARHLELEDGVGVLGDGRHEGEEGDDQSTHNPPAIQGLHDRFHRTGPFRVRR